MTNLKISTLSTLSCLFLLISYSTNEGRIYKVKSSNNLRLKQKTCKAYSNPKLHVLMDRICQLCHEMFSHSMPNFRAECTENCYKNTKFRNCLNMFSVLPSKTSKGNNLSKYLIEEEEEDNDVDDIDENEELNDTQQRER
uniref:Uncharacterized protein n=2 Tax=Meloidogyne TaxID=189290 RepID=A0A6V7Y990_MELEN|nr:unnamed protein product [Meloidogyne enterolobii]CAD2208086.1 unnamed protein product [Meloidogyne enterolobii]CAD2208934.1 unnamed protein product [Meloidogyne enterolobii]